MVNQMGCKREMTWFRSLFNSEYPIITYHKNAGNLGEQYWQVLGNCSTPVLGHKGVLQSRLILRLQLVLTELLHASALHEGFRGSNNPNVYLWDICCSILDDFQGVIFVF